MKKCGATGRAAVFVYVALPHSDGGRRYAGAQQKQAPLGLSHPRFSYHDPSETSRAEVLSDFKHYPVVKHNSSQELEMLFGIKGAKVIGLAKSDLARSLYAELKAHRISRTVKLSSLTDRVD